MMKSVFMSFYVTRHCIELSSCVCRNCSVRSVQLEPERGEAGGQWQGGAGSHAVAASRPTCRTNLAVPHPQLEKAGQEHCHSKEL